MRSVPFDHYRDFTHKLAHPRPPGCASSGSKSDSNRKSHSDSGYSEDYPG